LRRYFTFELPRFGLKGAGGLKPGPSRVQSPPGGSAGSGERPGTGLVITGMRTGPFHRILASSALARMLSKHLRPLRPSVAARGPPVPVYCVLIGFHNRRPSLVVVIAGACRSMPQTGPKAIWSICRIMIRWVAQPCSTGCPGTEDRGQPSDGNADDESQARRSFSFAGERPLTRLKAVSLGGLARGRLRPHIIVPKAGG